MDKDRPIISVVTNQNLDEDYNEYLQGALQQLEKNKSHIPFIHHLYVPFFEKGIPVVHLKPKRFPDGNLSYVLTTFMPKNISLQDEVSLENKIKELEEQYDISREELVFVKEKNSFGGYDYEFYPPIVQDVSSSLTEVCGMFYRDSKGLSTPEEERMFSCFRTFDLNKMLFSEDYYSYPINHNGCGAILINQEGRVILSPVTKNTHIETLSYLLSDVIGEDVAEKYTFPDIVSLYHMGVVMIRDGQTQIFIPSSITPEQMSGLSEVYEELYDVSCGGNFGNYIICATLDDDKQVNDAASTHDDIINLFNHNLLNKGEEGSNKKRA